MTDSTAGSTNDVTNNLTHDDDDAAVPPTVAREQWSQLSEALAALRAGGAASSFARLARDSQALRSALPARYDEVLQGLVDRLESAALFTEESCSFSQKDLIDSLQLWLDKAHAQLG